MHTMMRMARRPRPSAKHAPGFRVQVALEVSSHREHSVLLAVKFGLDLRSVMGVFVWISKA